MAGKLIQGAIPPEDAGYNSMTPQVPGGLRRAVRRVQDDLKSGPGGFLQSRFYTDFLAKFRGGKQLSPEEMLKQILFFVEVDFLLKTLNSAFTPRVISITTTPTEIISRSSSRYPRGYIILNPAEVTGFTSNFTYYASALRANGFAIASGNVNVSNVDRVATWLDVTAITLTPTLTVDVQSQDPLTSNFATVQSNIFGGAATVGTFYALIGQLGTDRISRLLATVGDAAGDDITFSVSGLAKGGSTSPVGSTIFIGDRNVNLTTGYRLLPSQKEVKFIGENVELFGVTSLDTLNVMVWELQ